MREKTQNTIEMDIQWLLNPPRFFFPFFFIYVTPKGEKDAPDFINMLKGINRASLTFGQDEADTPLYS